MRKHNNFYIIGVDAGYGNMKTARTIYPTGLVAMDTKPFFDGDILEYNNTWYRMLCRMVSDKWLCCIAAIFSRRSYSAVPSRRGWSGWIHVFCSCEQLLSQ